MLTTTQLDNAKPKNKSYYLYDILGLFIKITPTGSKLYAGPGR
jgi:hypothetical protein